MYDAVDISDDEDSFLLDHDAGVTPKDENLGYDLPPLSSRPQEADVASSSGTNLRSSFIGMGFAPSLVDKAIEENGEENGEQILETLFAYSDLQKPKTEVLDDGFSGGHNNSSSANIHAGEEFHKSKPSESLGSLFGEDTKDNAYCESHIPLKVEHDAIVGDNVIDEKTLSLLKMNFSLGEIRFAMQRLGKSSSIGRLMDFIFSARMARKYDKDTNNSIAGNDESGKDCNNEVIFGIMEKSLRLFEMGFSENDISAAFERCGTEAPTDLLAESIVSGGTCQLPDKYSSTYLSSSSAQRSARPSKRKMEECIKTDRFGSFNIKTEALSSGMASHVGTSDLLETPEDNTPDVDIDELINFKKPKEEDLEDSRDSVGRMMLEARIGNCPSSSVRNRAPVVQRQAAHISSFEEDWKPAVSLPNPRRNLTNALAKPPYFLYGNVTNLIPASWAKVTQFMYSLQPEFVDSQMFSALSRREGYVHNLPSENRSNISPKGPMTIAEAIHAKRWWPSWDNRKQLVHISGESSGLSYLCEKFGRMLAECNGSPSGDLQRNILQQCLDKNLVWVGKHKLAPLEPEHLELIMGYPQHHTQIVGYSSGERIKMLKQSFQTDTLGYHLSVLKRLCPNGVTVLSFFTGIGGAEVALHRLGIRLKGLVSVEACETKRRIVKKWWENSAQSGELIQLEGMSKLNTKKLEDLSKKWKGFDLIICQNITESEAFTGLEFSTFAEFVRIVRSVRSTIDRYR